MPFAALRFSALPKDDPLHRALERIGELYKATNFLTWWDARGFVVAGEDCDQWDPAARDQIGRLAAFVETEVLPSYRQAGGAEFADHVAKVGRVAWADVRAGLLDALKHHPVSGGVRPGQAALGLAPEAFLLLDLLEEQVASALNFSSAEALANAPDDRLRCARLRPRDGSAFEGTLYQHIFLVWAPAEKRLLWFDLGGSQ
jgi:hypothetical protein